MHKNSAGGKANGVLRRQDAIYKYLCNPKVCKQCGAQIPIKCDQKLSEVRKKKFCDRKCAALFNNSGRKKPKSPKKKVNKEPFTWLVDQTKGELFSKSKNWQSARTAIRKHATFIFGKESKGCSNCRYDKHIEICHIKSVSSFTQDTLISEINSKDNLLGLCPNCHWEYDNGLLKIAR